MNKRTTIDLGMGSLEHIIVDILIIHAYYCKAKHKECQQ